MTNSHCMGQEHGTGTWDRNMEQEHGTGTWNQNLEQVNVIKSVGHYVHPLSRNCPFERINSLQCYELTRR